MFVSRSFDSAAFANFARHVLSQSAVAADDEAVFDAADRAAKSGEPDDAAVEAGEEGPVWSPRLKKLILGPPRNLNDRSLFRHLSLAAFLAWVGLGADGLSSSCYGPAEAFLHLKGNIYLAVP